MPQCTHVLLRCSKTNTVLAKAASVLLHRPWIARNSGSALLEIKSRYFFLERLDTGEQWGSLDTAGP